MLHEKCGVFQRAKKSQTFFDTLKKLRSIDLSFFAFILPAAKITTSYASGKEELIAGKEVDKIKTPY